MKKFIAKFWRGNPQISGGGYETTREIEAKTITSATKKARQIEKGVLYGTMSLIEVKEQEDK